MKKKIAILGSTGSIGKSLLDIISLNKKDFEIVLLTANKYLKTLLKQSKKFNVKNLIITDKECFKKINNKNKKIKIFNNFDKLNKIFKKKIDYVMNSIVGFDGLKPTLDIIKFKNNLSLKNNKSIFCCCNII